MLILNWGRVVLGNERLRAVWFLFLKTVLENSLLKHR